MDGARAPSPSPPPPQENDIVAYQIEGNEE